MHDKKFIFDKNGAFGFYSGLTLQNAIGLTTPVPNTVEIVTNREKSRRREINVGNQKLCLRRSRTIVTSRNLKALQLLELMNSIDMKQLTNKELFNQAIIMASEAMIINPATIEKDYYVTCFLKELVASDPIIVFRRGTSLSKCYVSN